MAQGKGWFEDKESGFAGPALKSFRFPVSLLGVPGFPERINL